MPYTYGANTIQNIDRNGNALSSAFAIPGGAPVLIDKFCIGNYARLIIQLDRVPPDNFINKKIRINLGLFVASPPSSASSVLNIGFESDGFLTTTYKPGVFIAGGAVNAQTIKNYSSEFKRVGANQALIQIDFYFTFDVAFFASGSITHDNAERFLKSHYNTFGTILRNVGVTVYNSDVFLGVACEVFDNVGFSSFPTEGATSSEILLAPFSARWYNADLYDVTFLRRFMQVITAESASQIAAGLASLTAATAQGPQAPEQSVDLSFNVLRNRLSITEKNNITVVLRGANSGSSPNPANTDIRVVLMRLDDANNVSDFVTDLSIDDAVIPQLTPGVSQLDGAIYTPSDWVEDVPLPDDITLTFDIDGAELVFNGQYRIIVNVYDSVNDLNTSHISPVMVANYVPGITPDLRGFLDTYNKRYEGNDLSVIAPHSRFRSVLEIDKQSYINALIAAGIPAGPNTFDDALKYITCNFRGNGTTVPDEVEDYTPGTTAILSAGFEVLFEDANELVVASYFRVSEERAGAPWLVSWTLNFEQPSLSGQTETVDVIADQTVTINNFENDEVSPKIISIEYFDADFYPNQEIPISNICDVQKFACKVTKDPLFTGSINFIATIYPSDDFGDTTNGVIEEQESWTPTVIQLPQLNSGKLDFVDSAFVNDVASFLIIAPQLTIGQRYFVTAIAQEQVPSYCPIPGIAGSNIIMNTNPSVGAFKRWEIFVSLTNIVNAILGHIGYIGGSLNISKYEIIDSLGNIVPAQNVSGNVLTFESLSPSVPDILYLVAWIDFKSDQGSGPHNIRYTVSYQFERTLYPPGNTDLTNSTSYTCTDLG